MSQIIKTMNLFFDWEKLIYGVYIHFTPLFHGQVWDKGNFLKFPVGDSIGTETSNVIFYILPYLVKTP